MCGDERPHVRMGGKGNCHTCGKVRVHVCGEERPHVCVGGKGKPHMWEGKGRTKLRRVYVDLASFPGLPARGRPGNAANVDQYPP